LHVNRVFADDSELAHDDAPWYDIVREREREGELYIAAPTDPITVRSRPVNPDSDELIRVFARGILMCKLVNHIRPNTIDLKRIVTDPKRNTFQVRTRYPTPIMHH
jgi:hypothetical protein